MNITIHLFVVDKIGVKQFWGKSLSLVGCKLSKEEILKKLDHNLEEIMIFEEYKTKLKYFLKYYSHYAINAVYKQIEGGGWFGDAKICRTAVYETVSLLCRLTVTMGMDLSIQIHKDFEEIWGNEFMEACVDPFRVDNNLCF